MPRVNEIIENRPTAFKKRGYRPWNIEGDDNHNSVSEKINIEERIVLLDCKNIFNWAHNDRPNSELGDLEALAKDLINIGQQQPCIVRPFSSKPNHYELIIGERRWRAAKIAKIKLKVVIKDILDNEAALMQAAENDNRVDLSDYAKSTSFQHLITQKIITKKQLIEKLGKSKQYISCILSYSQIPDEIKHEIADFSKVSAKTAERIKQLARKGEEYRTAIISLANGIRQGNIGPKKLDELIKKILFKKNEKQNEYLLRFRGWIEFFAKGVISVVVVYQEVMIIL